MNLNLVILFPEWILLGILLIMLFGELLTARYTVEEKKIVSQTALVGALLVFLSVLPFAGRIDDAFGGMFILDPFATFFKAFFALVAVVIIQMSREFFLKRLDKPGEFYLVIWSSLIGLFFLVSANDLLLLFISLEIVTLSFYILASYLKRDLISIEAGLKYLILGSLASAFFIFGVSLIYVAAGSTALPAVREFFVEQPTNRLFLLGVLMILSGVGFKVASVPFQFWVPDVYEGAPTPVVAYLSVGSKAAGFAIFMRLLFTVFIPFDSERMILFAALAAMTLLYGNLGALVQTNIKRLFGYSSIGHAGYLLIAIAVGQTVGNSALLYYLIAYAVTTLAVFLVITIASTKLESDQIEAYSGLAKRSPFLAGTMFLALLSSAGVPPLAGFFGKFLVLLAAVRGNLGWLALLGAIGVVIALYYYLSIIKVMYMEEAASDEPIAISPSSVILLGLLIAGILLVGIWQTPFYNFAQTAAHYLS